MSYRCKGNCRSDNALAMHNQQPLAH